MRTEGLSNTVTRSHGDSAGVVGWYFFNLTNGDETLTDSIGIQVGTMKEAKTQALTAIEELRLEDGIDADAWQGWRLEVADRAGTVVFAVTLTNSVVESTPMPQRASGRGLSN